MPFHSLQATSQALQPMHSVESVKNAVMVAAHAGCSMCSFHCSSAAGPRSRRARLDVADQRLGFHDAHVRLLGDDQQIVGYVALDHSVVSPVIGQANLMHRAALHPQRPHARRHQHARLRPMPRGVMMVAQSPCSSSRLGGQFRRDLAEQLRLQLGQMRQRGATCRPPCDARSGDRS